MTALPDKLFYSTQIPACLWFITPNKNGGTGLSGRLLHNRSGEALFIDARNMGVMVDMQPGRWT
jgi:type I restriction enzyme M protein